MSLQKVRDRISQNTTAKTSIVTDEDGQELVEAVFKENPHNYDRVMSEIRKEFGLVTVDPKSDKLGSESRTDRWYIYFRVDG